MSGFFDEDHPQQPRRPAAGAAAAALPRADRHGGHPGGAFFLASVFTGIWTDRLWFRSVGYSDVFTTVLGTRVLLFLVFGLLLGAVVAPNIVLAFRFRPVFRPASQEQVNLDRYREVVEPMRRWLLHRRRRWCWRCSPAARAPGQWRQFLLWRNREPFGTKDPYFKRDVGFYVFELPWLHYVVDFAMAVTVLSLIAAAVVHYLFGGIRLQSRDGQAHRRRAGARSRCCSGCSCCSRPWTTGWTGST